MRWLVALLLVAACGDPAHPRRYPRWAVAADAGVAWRDCAGLRAFVRKSGKEGVGVALEVRSRTDCEVRITRVELILDDGTRAAGEVPALAPLRGRSLVHLWVPVRFDGDAAWNRGARRGRLEVELASRPPVLIPLVQRWDGPFGAP